MRVSSEALMLLLEAPSAMCIGSDHRRVVEDRSIRWMFNSRVNTPPTPPRVLTSFPPSHVTITLHFVLYLFHLASPPKRPRHLIHEVFDLVEERCRVHKSVCASVS